jgi:hypothetical protein
MFFRNSGEIEFCLLEKNFAKAGVVWVWHSYECD